MINATKSWSSRVASLIRCRLYLKVQPIRPVDRTIAETADQTFQMLKHGWHSYHQTFYALIVHTHMTAITCKMHNSVFISSMIDNAYIVRLEQSVFV